MSSLTWLFSLLLGVSILLLFLKFCAYFFSCKSFLFVFGGDFNFLARSCFARRISFNTLRLLSKGLCSSSTTIYFFASRSSAIEFIHRRSSSVGHSFSSSDYECSSLRLSCFSFDRCTKVLLDASSLCLGDTFSYSGLSCCLFLTSRAKRLHGKGGMTFGRCDKNPLLFSFNYYFPFWNFSYIGDCFICLNIRTWAYRFDYILVIAGLIRPKPGSLVQRMCSLAYSWGESSTISR